MDDLDEAKNEAQKELKELTKNNNKLKTEIKTLKETLESDPRLENIEIHKDENKKSDFYGQSFFYNTETGAREWDPWTEISPGEGNAQPYFYNTVNGESTWTNPKQELLEKNNLLLENQKVVEENDKKIAQLKEEIGQGNNEKNETDELLKQFGI